MLIFNSKSQSNKEPGVTTAVAQRALCEGHFRSRYRKYNETAVIDNVNGKQTLLMTFVLLREEIYFREVVT